MKLSRILRLACATAAFAALPALSARDASAQQWLSDRKFSEGAGIRVGNLELHPGIGAEVGYDSNYLLRTFRNGFVNSDPVEGGLLRVTPSLSLSTLTAPRLEDPNVAAQPSPIAFRAGVSATYREFIGPQVLRDQRNLSADLTARLDILQGRPIGFGVFASYNRTIQPNVTGVTDTSFNRDTVGGGAEVIVIPGGGTLDMRAGYQFNGQLFEESNGVPFNTMTHELSFRDRWKFRPRTALFSDTTLRFVSYPDSSRTNIFLNDSTPLRTRFGITGLVTDRFGLLLAAGYGATFFKNPSSAASNQYDSVNGQAEATIYLSQNPSAPDPGAASLSLSTLTFGYLRDFQNSLLGNYYTSNKGYGRLSYFFGGSFLMQLDANFEALSFPDIYVRDGAGNPQLANGSFTNYRVGGTLFGEYRFTNAFGLNATIDYTQMLSDTAVNSDIAAIPLPGGGGVPAGGQGGLYDLAWRRVQAFLGARYFF